MPGNNFYPWMLLYVWLREIVNKYKFRWENLLLYDTLNEIE